MDLDRSRPDLSCVVRDHGTPAEIVGDIKMCYGQASSDIYTDQLRKDLDVLFLIDNSPSMTPKQMALAQNIPAFIRALDDSGANYHIGIATSDVGSYTAPGVPWPVSLGSCNTFEGDDGLLQRVPCSTRTGVSDQAVNACVSLCLDPSFVPTDGTGFISKIDGVTNVPKDTTTMPGTDIGPQRAFQCMALVGDAGCGIEGQFEGVKRALDGHNPSNGGFLRPGSVLAVIVITDEDDCSVARTGRNENDPITMDCPNPDKDADFHCFNPDYRCLARDVVCDQPTNTLGLKTHCTERAKSYLEPVDTYVRFLQSLRPASSLVVSGIWAPSVDKGGTFTVIADTGPKTDQFNRGKGPDAACFDPMNPALFARPQVRLSKFIAPFAGSSEVSVCDVASYPRALYAIASAIRTRISASCLSVTPRSRGGMPLCVVGDVDAAMPGTAPDVAFPQCGSGCCAAWAAAALPTANDVGIHAACTGETTEACYCAVKSEKGVCAGKVVAGVWRKGGMTSPPGQVTTFQCAAE